MKFTSGIPAGVYQPPKKITPSAPKIGSAPRGVKGGVLPSQKSNAYVPPIKQPSFTSTIKPLTKEKNKALDALKSLGGDAKTRAKFISDMDAKKPFSGFVDLQGKRYQVVNGFFEVDGEQYAVSKDKRAVINRNHQIIGEIVNNEIRTPSASFLNEMSTIGNKL